MEKRVEKYSELDEIAIIDSFIDASLDEIAGLDDSKDPFAPLFGGALYKLVTENVDVQSELVDIQRSPGRRNDTPSHIIRFIKRQINRNHMTLDRDYDVVLTDPNFPSGYTQESDWQQFIEEALLTDHGNNMWHLRHANMQSNLYPRYALLKWLGIMFQERVGENPTTLDFGSSLNLGLNWLARNSETDNFPTERVAVVNSDFTNVNAENTHIDQMATTIFNERYIKAEYIPGHGHGLDLWRKNDAGNKLWAAACSSWFGELRDQLRLQRINQLSRDVPGIRFTGEVNCADEADLEKAIENSEKFNFVFISMMLHQNKSPEHEKNIIDNVKKYAKDYVVLFEVADADSNSPSGVNVKADLYGSTAPFGFKLLVLDMNDQQSGFQEFARFKNGRCNSVILNLGNKAVIDSIAL